MRRALLALPLLLHWAPAVAQAPLAYACGGQRVEVTPEGDGLVLALDGGRTTLRPAASTSGALYLGEGTTGPVEFWDRGGRARLTLGGRILPDCLRLGPVSNYRASGNEPFWNLRIAGDTARLDRFGQPLHETALDPPHVVGAATQRRGVAMAITVAPGPCRDSMTGVELPDRVTVDAGEARLAGCGASAEGRLLGDWRIETIGGQPAGGMRPATIAFRTAGAVFGQGPCNRFRGGWTMEGERLVLGQVAATMMACPDPAMAQEGALFRLLGTARAHRFTEDGALIIEGADGTTLLARRG